jgi:hypothetical protein
LLSVNSVERPKALSLVERPKALSLVERPKVCPACPERSRRELCRRAEGLEPSRKAEGSSVEGSVVERKLETMFTIGVTPYVAYVGTAEKKMDQLFEGNICAKALQDWSKIFGESQRDDLESFSNVFLASL